MTQNLEGGRLALTAEAGAPDIPKTVPESGTEEVEIFYFLLVLSLIRVQIGDAMTTLPEYVIKALERSQREAQEREEAAFQRGWEAATAALIQAANVARGTALPKNSTESEAETLVAQLVAAPNNRERVAIALKIRSGMRPVEVYGYLAQMGLPVKRHSILTIIKRMRGDNQVENKGKGLVLLPERQVT